MHACAMHVRLDQEQKLILKGSPEESLRLDPFSTWQRLGAIVSEGGPSAGAGLP